MALITTHPVLARVALDLADAARALDPCTALDLPDGLEALVARAEVDRMLDHVAGLRRGGLAVAEAIEAHLRDVTTTDAQVRGPFVDLARSLR